MTAQPETHPRPAARAAVERAWRASKRLQAIMSRMTGLLPTTPELARAFKPDAEERIDAFLFRLESLLSAAEDALEQVLLASEHFALLIGLRDTARDLERGGAIPSAERVPGAWGAGSSGAACRSSRGNGSRKP